LVAIAERGLSRCTPAEITARARTAPAALFHHFGSMTGFLVAAAEEAAVRQLVAFQSRLDAAPRDVQPIETALVLLRELTEDPVNAVFQELMCAARTDPELDTALQPQLEAYGRDIETIAAQLPGLSSVPPELFGALVHIALDVFRGGAVRGAADLDRI